MSLTAFIVGISASLFAALAIVLGARLVLQANQAVDGQTRLTKFLALGAGVFITVVCLDFIPDAWEMNGDSTPWWMFGGILLLWLVTQVVDRAFASSNPEASREGRVSITSTTLTTATAIVIGASLSFHTLLEGATLAVSLSHVNLASFAFIFALILHKLPEGVLWAMALQTFFDATDSARKMLIRLLVIPASCTLIGTLLGMCLVQFTSSGVVTALSASLAGALLYICMSELLPALREASQYSARLRPWFILGVLIMLIPVIAGTIIGG